MRRIQKDFLSDGGVDEDPNELIFGSGTTLTSFSSAGAGFTARVLNIYGNIAEDKIVSSVGSYNATATGQSNAWIMQMVTFRAKP